MQTTFEPKRLGLGILPVTASLLEDLFCLPEGYRIVGVSFDEIHRILNFTLASDTLPLTTDRQSLPQLQLHVTVETLPDGPPDYRKITTEVIQR